MVALGGRLKATRVMLSLARRLTHRLVGAETAATRGRPTRATLRAIS